MVFLSCLPVFLFSELIGAIILPSIGHGLHFIQPLQDHRLWSARADTGLGNLTTSFWPEAYLATIGEI
jgi:hypothetical protein